MGTGVVTYGTDPKARTIKVYYEGSDTLYTGSALCYNSDTTTNWAGVSSIDATSTASSITESATTAEGSQNEGKFIRVEKPATDNLLFFAGVVTPDFDGVTGPCAVDIFIPNGAIVPIRSSVYNYEGETVLAILSGDYEFQTPTYDGTDNCVPCAIAMEDVDRSSTEGVCLAKLLDPCVFTYNSAGFTGTTAGSSQRYELGRGVSSGTVEAMRWMFNFENTGGTCHVLRCRSELRGAANGGSPNGMLQFHTRVNSTSNTADIYAGVFTADLSGTSVTVSTGTKMCGLRASAGVAGSNTVLGSIYALHSAIGIAADTTFSGTAAHAYYEVTGGAGSTDAIFWFHAASLDALDASACTGDTAHDTSDVAIPVKIGSSTYYIVAQDSKG